MSPSSSNREIKIFDTTRTDELIAAIDPTAKSAIRDKLIVYLLVYTGIKVSELISLNRDNINPNLRQMTINRLQPCEILLNEIVSLQLEQYLSSRVDQHSALFINYSRKKSSDPNKEPRLTPRSIQRILKGLSHKSKLTSPTPSAIRNAFASSLFQSHKNSTKIQSLLGHENKGSTRNLKHALQKRQLSFSPGPK